MRKIAIFTEGQSELIFVRELLLKIIDLNMLSFECIKLHSDALQSVPYVYNNPMANVFFRIINVQNDSLVLTAIKEREKYFFLNGFEEIIGLRDMYCDYYDKHSPGLINEAVSTTIIESTNNEIRQMSEPDRIKIFFSIMELEAWFLSMYLVFFKINNLLSVNFMEDNLGYNIRDIDPQTKFYRPSNIMKKIFQLCGLKYDKSMDNIELIMANLDENDFRIGTENGKCHSLHDFYHGIKRFDNFSIDTEN